MSVESKISDIEAMEEKLRKACANNTLEEITECIEELDKSNTIDPHTKEKLVCNDFIVLKLSFCSTSLKFHNNMCLQFSTLLVEEAAKGHTETVKVLLEKGADVNRVNNVSNPEEIYRRMRRAVS